MLLGKSTIRRPFFPAGVYTVELDAPDRLIQSMTRVRFDGGLEEDRKKVTAASKQEQSS